MKNGKLAISQARLGPSPRYESAIDSSNILKIMIIAAHICHSIFTQILNGDHQNTTIMIKDSLNLRSLGSKNKMTTVIGQAIPTGMTEGKSLADTRSICKCFLAIAAHGTTSHLSLAPRLIFIPYMTDRYL